MPPGGVEDETGLKDDQNLKIWISHTESCISFRPQEGFEQVLFLVEEDMWRYIYRFLQHGYRIG